MKIPRGLLLKVWFTGSHPGTRFGIENASEPEFWTPSGSPPIRGVVGIPLFILTIPPNSHPRSRTVAGPRRDLETGICQIPLIDALCLTSKSDGAWLISGANQNQLVTEFENASPAMVAELSSIALLYVYEPPNWKPWLNLFWTFRVRAS